MTTQAKSTRLKNEESDEFARHLGRWQAVKDMRHEELLELMALVLEEERERRWWAAGRLIDGYVGQGCFPRNSHLERNVWRQKLRGVISRRVFRDIADNLRKGFSPLGDD